MDLPIHSIPTGCPKQIWSLAYKPWNNPHELYSYIYKPKPLIFGKTERYRLGGPYPVWKNGKIHGEMPRNNGGVSMGFIMGFSLWNWDREQKLRDKSTVKNPRPNSPLELLEQPSLWILLGSPLALAMSCRFGFTARNWGIHQQSHGEKWSCHGI